MFKQIEIIFLEIALIAILFTIHKIAILFINTSIMKKNMEKDIYSQILYTFILFVSIIVFKSKFYSLE